jgi:ribosome-binding protein aMBF1 (putative translation factor)
MQFRFSPGEAAGSSGPASEPVAMREPVDSAGVMDPAELRALGAAVREVRARRGLSQEGLGLAGGLHRNYVGGIERGELNITFRILLKLTRGLNVPLSELVALYERNRRELR